MIILSNNIRVPEDGDAGNVWSDALEYDMTELNSLITQVDNLSITDLVKPTKTITSANWVDVLDGPVGLEAGRGHVQTVSLDAGISLDQVNMRFRVLNGPKINRFINPTINPISLTAFDIIVNDSTLDLEILFL